MPQSPANTRAFLNSKFPPASGHSQVSHHENSILYILAKCKKKVHYCRNELPELIPDSYFAERRSTLKLQPAVPVPLEHLDPQTPELSQLVRQWQKLWLLAVARQNRLEQHQQTLKEVVVLFLNGYGATRVDQYRNIENIEFNNILYIYQYICIEKSCEFHFSNMLLQT